MASDEKNLGPIDKAWLFLTNSEYYRETVGPNRMQQVLSQLNQSNNAPFYNFSPTQLDQIAKGVEEASRGAIPLAGVAKSLATMPFSGGASVGTNLIAKFGWSGTVSARATAKIVDSLGIELAKVGVEMLAGVEIKKGRARQIAKTVGVGATGTIALHNMTPLLEKRFVVFAKRLSEYRMVGFDLSSPNTAQSAVDAGIVKKVISTIVKETEIVAVNLMESGRN